MEQDKDQLINDLTALVVRLTRRLNRIDPETKTADEAMDFLKRKNLLGSPLREDNVKFSGMVAENLIKKSEEERRTRERRTYR